jgi:hypothetical protein
MFPFGIKRSKLFGLFNQSKPRQVLVALESGSILATVTLRTVEPLLGIQTTVVGSSCYVAVDETLLFLPGVDAGACTYVGFRIAISILHTHHKK